MPARRVKALCGVAALLLLSGWARAQAQPDKRIDQKAAEHAAAHAADTPSAAHKQMAARAGEYATLCRFRMEPGVAPMESKGEAKIAVVLDGRFLLEENSGGISGLPWRGIRLFGYNNTTGKYETSWVYSQSTATLTMTGESSDGGKTVSFSGGYVMPEGGKQSLRVLLRQLDADRFVVTVTGVAPDGTEQSTLETTYSRRK